VENVMLDKRRRSPGAVIWYERSALESRGYSISDRRSGGFNARNLWEQILHSYTLMDFGVAKT
jgi:hypothetical protein